MAKKKSSKPKIKAKKGSKLIFWVVSILLILLIWGAVSISSQYNPRTTSKEEITSQPKETKTPPDTKNEPVKISKDKTKPDTVKNSSEKKSSPKKENTSPEKSSDKKSEQPLKEEHAPAEIKNTSHNLEYPKITHQGYVVENKEGRYTFCYSNDDRQSKWVAYILTSDDMKTVGSKRQDDFRADFRVMANGWQSAELSDYRGSGYDRGHLVPSADRNNSKEENSATFLLSNISPQAKNLNRFAWNGLESEVRRLTKKYDTVYIATGGVLHNPTDKPLKKIGNGVTVPPSFFKALLIKYNGKYYAIGYLMPNKEDCDKDFTRYAVTVDSLENITGLDFFNSLDDSIQKSTENVIDKRFWFK